MSVGERKGKLSISFLLVFLIYFNSLTDFCIYLLMFILMFKDQIHGMKQSQNRMSLIMKLLS